MTGAGGPVPDFTGLTTPLVADACLRLDLPVRAAPPGIAPVLPGRPVAGRALPARHHGSVDIFLMAIASAEPGDVLVVDNNGRTDEACIGDLVVLEARERGLAGIVVWGLHRDTADLERVGLPVFSYGRSPVGPTRLDAQDPHALRSARIGEVVVDRTDFVLVDEDGALFVSEGSARDVARVAREIRDVEREQAERVSRGENLYQQFDFPAYLERRAQEPAYTFRHHLRSLGGAIEE